MAITARGVIARTPGAPAEVEEFTIDDPGPNEVLVRIKASGVCHTDLGVKMGVYGSSGFPFLLGHEGAGIVEAVGEGVGDVAQKAALLRVRVARAASQVEQPERGVPTASVDVGQVVVARDAQQQAVDLIVDLDRRALLRRDDRLLRDLPLQLGDVGGGAALDDQPREQLVERLGHLERLLQVGDGHVGHERAAPRQDHDEPLVRQPLERVAQRRASDVEAVHQV